jgi:hypothetical protein
MPVDWYATNLAWTGLGWHQRNRQSAAGGIAGHWRGAGVTDPGGEGNQFAAQQGDDAIDCHLRKVFTELGITSRTELARRPVPRARPTEQQDRRSRRSEHSPARGIVEACNHAQPPPPTGGSQRGS